MMMVMTPFVPVSKAGSHFGFRQTIRLSAPGRRTAAGVLPAHPSLTDRSEDCHVRSLEALGARLYLKLNPVTLVQALIARADNGFEMNEHIFAVFTLDESEAL